MHRSVLYRLAVFSVLCLAATATQARASTFCVADPACVAEGHHNSGANLADGIADAAAHAGDDTVRVGPGSFKGPFAYTAPGDLTLVGAGPATVLYLPPATAGATLLALDHSSVASLRLTIGAGEGNIGARLFRGSATDVAIEFGAGSTSSVGVSLTGGSLHDVRVVAPSGAGSTAVWADTLPFRISGSELHSEHGVVSSSPLGASRIDTTRIDARFAIMHHCGELVVDDTLIWGERVMHAAWARDVSCAGDTALTLRHTTIVGAGRPREHRRARPGRRRREQGDGARRELDRGRRRPRAVPARGHGRSRVAGRRLVELGAGRRRLGEPDRRHRRADHP